MKKFLLLFTLFLAACAATQPPPQFVYQEVPAGAFTLASWSKISAPQMPVRFYIEGDGHAFNSHGRPSANPTPKDHTLRRLAFADPAPNVIYLARPCQYIQTKNCVPAYWSNARFAPEVIDSTATAIQQLAPNTPLTLIGFSGGAQVAGLVAVTHPNLEVTKLVTIAGNLDHPRWTKHHHLPTLDGSLSLTAYRQAYLALPQHHFVGEADEVIPAHITSHFVGNSNHLTRIKNISHAEGWDSVAEQIYLQ